MCASGLLRMLWMMMDSSWIRVLVARASTGRRWWPDAQRWDAHVHFSPPRSGCVDMDASVVLTNGYQPGILAPIRRACLAVWWGTSQEVSSRSVACVGRLSAPAIGFRVVPSSLAPGTLHHHPGGQEATGRLTIRAHAIPCFLKSCICMHAYFDWETKRAIRVEIKYTKQVHNRWAGPSANFI
jgi:hypothetical protein